MSKKLTNNEFIEKARKIHGDKYDYSKVNYIESGINVIITCPIHGDFPQTPENHIQGNGCPKCAGRYMDTEYFKEKARKIHGDKYGYDKVNYTKANKEVIITCPIHGDFSQTPNSHLKGRGCKECAALSRTKKRRSTTEEFIAKAKEVHGDKYNYDKVNYVDNHTDVIITCPIHGDFPQAPANHLSGKGCKKCGYKHEALTKRKPTEKFIEKAKKKHGDKYDYSKVDYVNNHTDVIITCPKHGDFSQTPYNHLKGSGCKKCGYEQMSAAKRSDLSDLSLRVGEKYSPYEPVEEFKNQFSKIHATCKIHGKFKTNFHRLLQGHGCPDCGKSAPTDVTRYDLNKYNKVFFSRYPDSHLRVLDYVRSGDPSEIECLDCNSRFWRSPNALLGNPICPNCYERVRTFKLEENIKKLLIDNSIKFDSQKTFLWLKNKSSLYLDFYLPSYNIAIECQGLQHFQPVDYFGGEENFKIRLENDKLKLDLCTEHGIQVIYYSDLGIDYPYEVIEDLDQIVQTILNHKKGS